MLFDLSSPGRKTAVRIIFGFLALIFAVGFVFLGIGTDAGLNPFDSGGGSTDDALEQQIEDAEQAVADAPNDPEPLASLIVIRAQSGDRQLELDEETQTPVALTEDSRSEYEETISLWQDYLAMKPRKINPAAAGAVVQSYRFLGDTEGAIEAQRAFAESDPTAVNLGFLAQLLYFDLQIDEGDKAADDALAAVTADDDKQLLSKQLEQIRKQALKAEEEQKKLDKQEGDTPTGESSELSDPFGGLSPAEPSTGAP
jgi:hypothetical protein